MIELWTDGSCLKNPGGAGGWACVIVRDNVVVAELHGGEPETTNNRMEITAVLMGLAAVELTPGQPPTVVSDSKYVVNGATWWMHRWKRQHWLRAQKPIPNADLWQRMHAEVARTEADFRWVRGHNGEALNVRADLAASKAARAMLRATEPA